MVESVWDDDEDVEEPYQNSGFDYRPLSDAWWSRFGFLWYDNDVEESYKNFGSYYKSSSSNDLDL